MSPARIRTVPPISTASRTNGGDSATCIAAAGPARPRTIRKKMSANSSAARWNRRLARPAPPNVLTTAMPCTNSTTESAIRPIAASNSACSRCRADVVISGTTATASSTGTRVINVSRQSTVNR
ncbi:Uncharacterised protein [Mycobacteroides abscessus subsp. abscessus]|nr:Uncharacterised protein [Mycobacteroides abscessus subsp. abscessus]